MAFAVSGAGGGGGSVVPFPSVTSNVPSTAPSQPLVHTGDMGTPAQSPMYDGPPINSIQHTAESLGAPFHTDTATGLTTVNGNTIKPTSFQNGVPHGPVRDVAIAAGYPATHIQTSGNSGNVTVMPKPPAPPDQALVHPGNMGLPTITSPTAGQPYTPPVVGQPASTSPAQALVHTGNMGVPNPQPVAPNQALVHPGNMAPPPAAGVSVPQVSNMSAGATQAPAQAPAGSTAAAGGYNTGNPQLDQALQMVTQWIQSQSANPYQYQLPTQPQYNFDMGQAAQQAFNTENPIYQAQIATADQRINDQMNRRGIYTSGIAQQAVDSQNAALYQNMDNAIQKDITAQQNSYNTGYNDQMNGWRDNVNAMHQQGQLNDTQARDMLNAINDMATQLNKQDTTQAGIAKAQLPYQQPTAYQQGQLNNAAAAEVNKALNAIGYGYNPTTGQIMPTVQATNDNATQAYHQGQLNNQTVTTINKALNGLGLGYNPTTGQISSTLAANNDAANRNLKALIAIGYAPGADGKLHPTVALNKQEQANAIAIGKLMGYMPDGKGNLVPTLGSRQLQEKTQHDQATVNVANKNATTTANRVAEQTRHDKVTEGQGQQKVSISGRNATTAANRLTEQTRHNKASEGIQQQNATTSAKNSTERALVAQGLTTDPRTGKIVPTLAANNSLNKQQQTSWSTYVTKTTTQLNDQIQQARQVISGAAVNSGSYSPAEVQAAHSTISTAMQGLQNLTVAPASPQVSQYIQDHPGASVVEQNKLYNDAVNGAKSGGSSGGSKSTAKPPVKKK